MSNADWALRTIEDANLQIQAGNPRFALRLLAEVIQRESSIAAAYNTMSIAALSLGEGDAAVQAASAASRLAPRDAACHYNLGRALKMAGRAHDAVQAYRTAIRLSPGTPEYHVSLAIAYRATGKTDKAIAAYRSALRLRPGMVEAIHNLANLQSEAGDAMQAEAGYRRALGLRPDYAPSLYELGNLVLARGNRDEAENFYRAAVNARQNYAKAWYALGKLRHERRDLAEAETCLGRAASLGPGDARTLLWLGIVQNSLGKTGEAIDSFQKCLDIEPGNVEALIQSGVLMRNTGQHMAAVRLLETATAHARDTRLAEADFRLAEALMDIDAYAPAARAIEEGLSLKPDESFRRVTLGTAYRMLGRMEDADKQAGILLAEMPDSLAGHALKATVLADCGEVEQASASFYRAAAAAPEEPAEHGKFCMSLNYIVQAGVEDIYLEHREFGQRFADGLRTGRPHANEPDPSRRLKVGYVSPDFRNHSVAWFLEPVLRSHGRGNFELHAYYTHARSDAVTERLRGRFDNWTEAKGLTDEALAERIRADGIDILIDLAGHTAGNRLGVFARKPAPVQMSWLGYLSTTGVRAIDYRITDAQVDPMGYEAWQVEEPLRLPKCYVCYGPPEDAPEVGPLPALARGGITFGSFNNLAKLSAATLALWARVLQSVPDSRLLLKSKALADESVRARIAGRLAARGIEAGRLILTGWEEGRDAHLERYNQVDIALDTYPYNGVTTTCEALWMGVPVLSRTGATQASRQGLSLLKAVGLEQLACADDDALAARARALAADLPGLAELRAGLRERMLASPLTDAKAFTRQLEQAYRKAWKKWCASAAAQAGKPPGSSAG